MTISSNFLDLSVVTIPSNAPLERVTNNNYVIKATGTISLTLTDNLGGDRVLVSASPTVAPTTTYTSTSNVALTITLNADDYMAIVGF
jgi:hypothetical protein